MKAKAMTMKFKSGDKVRIKETAFKGKFSKDLYRWRGATVEVSREGNDGIYWIKLPAGEIWIKPDEIDLVEAAQPAPVASEPDAGITAHLESYFMDDEPTHATEQMWIDAAALSGNDVASTQDALTPDEVDALRLLSAHGYRVEAGSSAIYGALVARNLATVTDKRRYWYTYAITAAGREHLATLASEPDSALTPDVTTVEPPSNMFIRDVDEPYYQHREIYPFLPPVVSPYELAHGGYLYVDKETSELCFNMQLRRLDPNDTRKLIAALEYALSTITD